MNFLKKIFCREAKTDLPKEMWEWLCYSVGQTKHCTQEIINKGQYLFYLLERPERKKGEIHFVSTGIGIEVGHSVMVVDTKTWQSGWYEIKGSRSCGCGDDLAGWDDGREWQLILKQKVPFDQLPEQVQALKKLQKIDEKKLDK
jgi:hypothetical protein